MFETASQKKKERTIEEKRRELVKGGVNWRKMEGFVWRRDFFFSLLHYKIKNRTESFT